MKYRKFFLPILLAAAAGFALRLTGANWIALAALSAAAALYTALRVRALPEKAQYGELFRGSVFSAISSVAAAGLILAANILAFLQATGATRIELLISRLDAILGALFALAIIASAAARLKKKTPAAWTALLPTAFLLLNLVLNFRRWSVDPVVLDYCYKLFFSICAMLGVYYTGGYLFDKGKRRVSAFWCLLGVFFAGVTLADGGPQHCLLAGGLLLLLAENAWQLLRAH